jgi:hypothetical protein
LKKFHDASLLQQECGGCINLHDVWMLFERQVFDFGGVFEKNLSPNADIDAFPQFEAAIVKYNKEVEALTHENKEQLKCFDVETLDLTQNKVEELNSASYSIKALFEGRK